MKKTCGRNKYIFLLLIAVCLFIFNSGCVLDVFYFIDAPYTLNNQPNYSSTEFSTRYFSFNTNETSDSNTALGERFLGTDVYYKIYNSSSQMDSEVSSIQSIINNSTNENSNTAAYKIIDSTSSSYAYQKLRVSDRSDDVFIPATGNNRSIYIRLSDYLDTYPSAILAGSNDKGSPFFSAKSKPVRSNSYTFNFGRSGAKDTKPVEGDPDVKFTSGINGSKWYIAMFAVSVARDETYSYLYSNLLYLGSITIDAAEQNN